MDKVNQSRLVRTHDRTESKVIKLSEVSEVNRSERNALSGHVSGQTK